MSIAQVVATAVVVLTVGVSVQQKPNFSGRWVIVSTKGAGTEQIVIHDEKTLTTENADASHKMVFQLDGVERRQAIPGHGTDVTVMATAGWEGDHVVITTDISYATGMKTQSKEVWSLDAQGHLVIEVTETGPGAPPQTTKVIYMKKS